MSREREILPRWYRRSDPNARCGSSERDRPPSIGGEAPGRQETARARPGCRSPRAPRRRRCRRKLGSGARAALASWALLVAHADLAPDPPALPRIDEARERSDL